MKIKKFAKILIALVALIAISMPMGLVYAEEPTHLSEVDSIGGFGAPFQHHSFIDDGRQWVFYTLSNNLVYSTSTNMVTWTDPTILHYCGDTVDVGGDWEMGADYTGTQFDLWYDGTNNKVDIVLLNVSGNNSPLLYARFTPNSSTGLLTNVTSITPWQSAVSGATNVSYVLPSICVTPTQQPIIAYTKLNASATPVIDVGVIGFANPGTGSLMALTGTWPKYNLSATGNASAFGSVIPLLSGNISVQFVQAESAEGYLKQAIIGITNGADKVGTDYYVDSLAQPSAPGFLWDYNAVSVHTDAVTASGNEDVMAVWNRDEGEGGSSLQFNRLADSVNWDGSYATQIDDDDIYIGALGVRDDVGNLVYSAISYSESDCLYSWDYDLGTDVGSAVDVIDEPDGVQYAVMANYQRDLEGDENTGFIYQGTGFEVMYAAYETSPITSSGSDTIDSMTWLIPVILIAGIIAASAGALLIGGFSIGSLIIAALFMVIGLAMVSTLTTMIANLW